MTSSLRTSHPVSGTIRIVFLTSLFVAVLIALQALAQPPATPSSVLKLEPVVSPAGAGTSEPQFTSQGSTTTLSWVDTSKNQPTLNFSQRISSGWSPAKSVPSEKGFLVNSADVPAVRALTNGTFVAQWLQRIGADEDTDAYNLRLSWSRDQGRTWSPPMSPHHDGTMTQHGFASLFETPGSGLGLVWLDGRATNPQTEAGDMSLRASLYDGAGTQLREMLVASRVCDCCSTSITQTSDGPLVAFRNRTANEIRDIYVSRLVRGSPGQGSSAQGTWTAPVAVHNDAWRIEACPINGPSISALGRNVAVAWFTGKDDQPRTFIAFSSDAGRTFGAPIRVNETAARGRVGVQLIDGHTAAVTWVESAGEHSAFRVRTVSAAGAVSAPVNIAAAVSGFPRIARVNGELLFAWTQAGATVDRIRTARAALPPSK